MANSWFFRETDSKHFSHSYALNLVKLAIFWGKKERKKELSCVRRKFIEAGIHGILKKNAFLFNVRLPQRRHQMPRAFPRRSEIPQDPVAAYKSSLQQRAANKNFVKRRGHKSPAEEEVGEVLPQNRLKIMHNTRRHVARKNANW